MIARQESDAALMKTIVEFGLPELKSGLEVFQELTALREMYHYPDPNISIDKSREQLAQRIVDDFYIMVVDGTLQMYNHSLGIYQTGEYPLSLFLQRYIGVVNGRALSEIVKMVISKCQHHENLQPPEGFTCIGNGVLNKKTKELLPYSPEYYFTARANASYRPELVHAEFDVIPWFKGLVTEEDFLALCQLVYSVIDSPKNRRKAYFLFGKGRDGKSTLLEILSNIAGTTNTATCSLKEFEDKYGLESLANKSLICSHENDGITMKDSSTFKKAVSRDLMKVEKKGKNGFTMEIRLSGVIVQATNVTFNAYDKSTALTDRFLFIHFPALFKNDPNFVDDRRIKEIFAKQQDVADILATWIIDNVDDFDIAYEPQSHKNKVAEWTIENNPVEEMFLSLQDAGIISKIPKKVLYRMYCLKLLDEKRGRPSKLTTFYAELKTVAERHGYFERKSSGVDQPSQYRNGKERPVAVQWVIDNLTSINLFSSPQHTAVEEFKNVLNSTNKREMVFEPKGE